MNVKPVRWEIENSSIYIELQDGSYFVCRPASMFSSDVNDELILKEYAPGGPYFWRSTSYESKYDVVKFPTLQSAIEAIRKVE